MSAPRSLYHAAQSRRAPDAPALLSREEAQAFIERAVKRSRAESVAISLETSYSGNTRFAANQITTAGGVLDARLAVTSSFGPKRAAVATNDLSDAAVERALRQSESLARLAPDDPEVMPLLGAQQYVRVDSYAERTAAFTPAERARAALTALAPARSAGDLAAAGFLVTGASAAALGNSAGLFAYQRETSANYTLTVRTADGTGSGWAGADHPDIGQLDFSAVSARAIDKARRSRNPVAIEPGRYTVILEPQAAGDLVQLIAEASDARSADEGRSPFSAPGGGNKIGQKIVDGRITILSDPADPQLLSTPFDGDGFPLARQVWIENGVLKQLSYSRYWARRTGKQPTGRPRSLKMLGGAATVDEMIANTARGVLVTRLWYLREVDPRTILYTGLTRDGTFLIENGKIASAVKNFRFNESPLFMLNNVEALGRPVRLAGTEEGGAVVMPPLEVRDFNFTSLSEAV